MKVIHHPSSDHPRGAHGRVRRLRTVAIFPTMLTLGNMLCGFAAIYLCLLGVIDNSTGVTPAAKLTLGSRVIEDLLPTYLSAAGMLIFVGMFFDMMDGRVARMTTGKTNFGGQLDSLADMVTFGAAPPVLVIVLLITASQKFTSNYLVSVRVGWVAGAIFVSCCGLRLARFNVEHAETDLRHTTFHGLPSPAAAAVIASLVILYEHVAEVRGLLLVNLLPLCAIASGLLMVSRVRYVHLGNTYLRARKPFSHVAVMVGVAGLVIYFPAPMLAILVGAYALSGPIAATARRLRRDSGEGHHGIAEDASDSANSRTA